MSAGLPVHQQQGNWRRLYASGKGTGRTLFLSPSFRGRICSEPIIFSIWCRQVAERCLLITPGTDRLFSSRDSSNEIPMSSTARPANADRLNTTTAGRQFSCVPGERHHQREDVRFFVHNKSGSERAIPLAGRACPVVDATKTNNLPGNSAEHYPCVCGTGLFSAFHKAGSRYQSGDRGSTGERFMRVTPDHIQAGVLTRPGPMNRTPANRGRWPG